MNPETLVLQICDIDAADYSNPQPATWNGDSSAEYPDFVISVRRHCLCSYRPQVPTS